MCRSSGGGVPPSRRAPGGNRSRRRPGGGKGPGHAGWRHRRRPEARGRLDIPGPHGSGEWHVPSPPRLRGGNTGQPGAPRRLQHHPLRPDDDGQVDTDGDPHQGKRGIHWKRRPADHPGGQGVRVERDESGGCAGGGGDGRRIRRGNGVWGSAPGRPHRLPDHRRWLPRRSRPRTWPGCSRRGCRSWGSAT